MLKTPEKPLLVPNWQLVSLCGPHLKQALRHYFGEQALWWGPTSPGSPKVQKQR